MVTKPNTVKSQNKYKWKRIESGIYFNGVSYYILYYFEGQINRESIGSSLKLARKVLVIRKAAIANNNFQIPQKREIPMLYSIINDFLAYSKVNKRSYLRDTQ